MTTGPDSSRVGKRAELRAKRRKQRRRLVISGASAFVVLLVLLTVVLVKNGGKDSKTVTKPSRTQQTLLLQIASPDGTSSSSALLADDRPSGQGAVILIQPEVLANVPGIGTLPFGSALHRGGVTGARNALSDLMGVTIDGSWSLDAPSFQKLIDQAGGVSVDVDVPVISGRTVLLNPGNQHLGGAQALAFADYLGPGEDESLRLTRLQDVLDAFILELPDSVASLVGSLGGGSVSTLPNATLAGLLGGVAKDDKAKNLQYATLPVTKVDVGDGSQRFRIDPDGSKALVDNLLKQSIPEGSRASGNRVLVLNGVGPSLGQTVRNKLVPAGFVYVGSRNAPSFGYKMTQVLVPSATEADAALGDRVAKALGVPTSSVMTTDGLGTVADVVVIIGADFKAK